VLLPCILYYLPVSNSYPNFFYKTFCFILITVYNLYRYPKTVHLPLFFSKGIPIFGPAAISPSWISLSQNILNILYRAWPALWCCSSSCSLLVRLA